MTLKICIPVRKIGLSVNSKDECFPLRTQQHNDKTICGFLKKKAIFL